MVLPRQMWTEPLVLEWGALKSGDVYTSRQRLALIIVLGFLQIAMTK